MDNKEKLFTLECQLNDQDYENVFQIYLETEHKSDKKTAWITGILAMIFFVAITIWQLNFIYLVYAAVAFLISYMGNAKPNRHFIATNRALMGTHQQLDFYPYTLESIEIYDEEEAAADSETTESEAEEADEPAFSVAKTSSLKAYENEQGFLFADRKIYNFFFYVPKRDRTPEEIEQLKTYAKERCSGGYLILEMQSILTKSEQTEETENFADTNAAKGSIYDEFYSLKNVNVRDEQGRRVTSFETEDLDASAEKGETDENTEQSHQTDSP